MERIRKMSVARAAALMGKSSDFLRWGLQQGKFPFGVAVQTKHGAGIRYNYFIVPKALADYLGLKEEELWEE